MERTDHQQRSELLSQANGGGERVETACWRASTEKQGFSKHAATCGSVQPVFRLSLSTSSWWPMAAPQVKDPSPEAHLVPDQPV